MNFNKNQVKGSTKIIAIDFDGTIVEHRYPDIGPEMMFAFTTIRELQNRGHQLILWTYRDGELLDEAVKYCYNHGVQFYAVNENFPGESKEECGSRKIYADIYIDDRNIGGFPGWINIWEQLHPEGGHFLHQLQHELEHHNYKMQHKNLFGRIFNR